MYFESSEFVVLLHPSSRPLLDRLKIRLSRLFQMNMPEKPSESNGKVHRKVGLVYDETMCKHDTPDGEAHPERPDRIRVIWEKLQLAGVTQRLILSSLENGETCC